MYCHLEVRSLNLAKANFITVRAPIDCVQYFTGATGSVKSYNFQGGQLLTSQYYTNCIRTEKGYCGKIKDRLQEDVSI